jgi:hypothetical protein
MLRERWIQIHPLNITAMRSEYEHAIATLIRKPPTRFNISPEPQIKLQFPTISPPANVVSPKRTIRFGIARAILFSSLVLGATGGFEGTSVMNWFN